MKKDLNILICPLNWGLGHAGRIIPLALKLISMNQRILIGTSEENMALFRQEIPGIRIIPFPGFRIRYSGILPQYIVILLRIPVMIYNILKEHKTLKGIIEEHKIDIVISDSRIGLWNKSVKTVLISHIMRIPYPKALRFLENIGNPLSRYIIRKFSYCYIPDLDGENNVSGRLSHGMKLAGNVRFIGILSKFGGVISQDRNVKKKYKFAVILSGPEPQKEIFKQKVICILEDKNVPAIILEGKPGNKRTEVTIRNILLVNHLGYKDMHEALLESENIISRSGYTTIMELISIFRSAVLIPTPGQTEQEYLAEYMSSKGWFKTVRQKDLDKNPDFSPVYPVWPENIIVQSEKLLNAALMELLEQ